MKYVLKTKLYAHPNFEEFQRVRTDGLTYKVWFLNKVNNALRTIEHYQLPMYGSLIEYINEWNRDSPDVHFSVEKRRIECRNWTSYGIMCRLERSMLAAVFQFAEESNDCWIKEGF